LSQFSLATRDLLSHIVENPEMWSSQGNRRSLATLADKLQIGRTDRTLLGGWSGLSDMPTRYSAATVQRTKTLKLQLMLTLEELAESELELTWENISLLLLDLNQSEIAKEAAIAVANEKQEYRTEAEALVGVPLEKKFHLKLRFARNSAGVLKGSGLPQLPSFRWIATADRHHTQELLHLCVPPTAPPLCARRQAASKNLQFKQVLSEGTTPESMRTLTSRKEEGMCSRCLAKAPPALKSAVLEALNRSL